MTADRPTPTVQLPGGAMPLWPWITGGAVLLGTGYAVARRLSRADA